jgi:hypothetical protein
MEPESQMTQLPEVRSGVGDLVSQIRKYITALERLTHSNQVEYNHLKNQGDNLVAAKAKSYLTKAEYNIRSMIQI